MAHPDVPSQETASLNSQKHGGDTRRCAITREELDDLQWANHVHVSDQTVKDRLHEGGMKARRPLMGPVLTAQHLAARLAFAREHQDWQVRHWRPVLFTGESRFTIST